MSKKNGMIDGADVVQEQLNQAEPTPSEEQTDTVSATSPVPVKKIDMLTFSDALREVLNGKKLTRVSWEDNEIYVFIANEFLSIKMGDTVHQLIVSVADMQGADWFVLPEEGEHE